MLNPADDIMQAFLFYMILIFILIAMGIYGFVLFVKLARRGIKALDIYIAKNISDK
ncbi:hypothetical protein [Clostridium sp. ZS2-4]|uniref:hypothetical protein n=1 Tax=Clostridium sp. ZS2-4 TaxID=2987703 RepID=UPI00227C0105|nr:hypothetical protein [Clostridium sp. ZS2-4]MCY6354827.1 hypothetical protein [Clostridium sp. ZS2-4]